jgi:hypothetical protein
MYTTYATTTTESRKRLFEAMHDEQQRALQELKIGSLPSAYYVESSLTLRRSMNVHGVLGTIDDVDTATTAQLTVRVRVGNQTFDNTNFFDVSFGFFGSADDEEMFQNRRVPVQLDYHSLRRECWLAFDACFKQAVESYAKKEASLKNRTRTDTTPDFILLKPEQLEFNKPIALPDVANVKVRAESASALFMSFPSVYRSRVGFEIVTKEVLYCNSEGRTSYKTENYAGIEAIASTQATDGTPLAQAYSAYAPTFEKLPSVDSLARAVTVMAELLTKQIDQPRIEAYSGPVLFQAQAAAELIAQQFIPQCVAQRPPVSEGGFSAGEKSLLFQNKIGARVLPEFLSVKSLPTMFERKGMVFPAAYTIDDEGMLAKNLTVVNAGYLETLLSSRIPTKKIRESHGHCRGGGAMYSVVEVTCSDQQKALPFFQLRKSMLDLVKKRGLPYGIIVTRLLNTNILYTGLYGLMGGDIPVSQGEGKIGILEAYKVFPNGSTELLRGVELAGTNAASFKDILRVGSTSAVYSLLATTVVPSFVSGGSQYQLCTIITPDLLLEDAEIRPLEGDMPKPPAIVPPLR